MFILFEVQAQKKNNFIHMYCIVYHTIHSYIIVTKIVNRLYTPAYLLGRTKNANSVRTASDHIKIILNTFDSRP